MNAGRVASLVVGCLLIMPGVGLLLGAGSLGLAALFNTDDGYIEGTLDPLRTEGVAVTAEGVSLVNEPDTPGWLLEALSLESRLAVTGDSADRVVFIGIASEESVDAYLAGIRHTEVVELRGATPDLREQPGTDTIAPPDAQTFWEVSASGVGTQTLEWTLESGNWSVVVMNADGSPGVVAEVTAGIRAGFIGPLALVLLLVGLAVTIAGVVLIVVGAQGLDRGADTRRRSDGSIDVTDAAVAGQPAATPGGWSEQPDPHPVSLTARLDRDLSRWMWLVKWVLAIPHVIVLALLWIAFAVVTVVAFFSILVTGRYPRSLFDFNVGVMRWSYRVSYYAGSGGLGTDQYPPFSLADDPAYPARFSVAYPEQLSRGLVLVKWWLLVLPHYLIVGLLVGGSFRWLSATDGGIAFDVTTGGGVLGVLVFAAGLILLFTGRYSQSLFDVVIGLNRWVYRVGAYATLMTDTYPPFRLDQGGPEPTPDPPSAPSGPMSQPPALSAPTHRDLVS